MWNVTAGNRGSSTQPSDPTTWTHVFYVKGNLYISLSGGRETRDILLASYVDPDCSIPYYIGGGGDDASQLAVRAVYALMNPVSATTHIHTHAHTAYATPILYTHFEVLTISFDFNISTDAWLIDNYRKCVCRPTSAPWSRTQPDAFPRATYPAIPSSVITRSLLWRGPTAH